MFTLGDISVSKHRVYMTPGSKICSYYNLARPVGLKSGLIRPVWFRPNFTTLYQLRYMKFGSARNRGQVHFYRLVVY